LQLSVQTGYLGLFFFILVINNIGGIISSFLAENPDNIFGQLIGSVILYIFLMGNIETLFTPSVYFFTIVLYFVCCCSHSYFDKSREVVS
jgi:hypothetical protein